MKHRQFVKTLPCYNPLRFMRGRVEKLSDMAYLMWWMSNIQPYIDNLPGRSDQSWNWPRFYVTRNLYESQYPIFYALLTNGVYGPVVLALCYCLGQTKFPSTNEAKAVFVWRLSAAPSEALERHLPRDFLRNPRGSAVFDAALLLSLTNEHEGRLWLHAAPKGGDKLANFYESWGMQNVPEHVTIKRYWRSVNDGRYFFHNAETTEVALSKFDAYR